MCRHIPNFCVDSRCVIPGNGAGPLCFHFRITVRASWPLPHQGKQIEGAYLNHITTRKEIKVGTSDLPKQFKFTMKSLQAVSCAWRSLGAFAGCISRTSLPSQNRLWDSYLAARRPCPVTAPTVTAWVIPLPSTECMCAGTPALENTGPTLAG